MQYFPIVGIRNCRHIFFAVSEKSGKDNSGEYVYAKDESGRLKLDNHGHYIVDHDLHNHDKDLPDGIAEAFIDFVKQNRKVN